MLERYDCTATVVSSTGQTLFKGFSAKVSYLKTAVTLFLSALRYRHQRRTRL